MERDRSLTPPALEALRHLRDSAPAPEDGRAFWAFEPLLSTVGDHLRLTRPDPEGAAAGMLAELAEWRLTALPGQRAAEAPALFTAPGPHLWREYLREDIPPLFGARFSPGNWNAGIVRLNNTLILLTTLKKGGLTAGQPLRGPFPRPRPHAMAKPDQRPAAPARSAACCQGQTSRRGSTCSSRNGKLRNGKAAPFLYCGQPGFAGWEGEKTDHGDLALAGPGARPPAPRVRDRRMNMNVIGPDLPFTDSLRASAQLPHCCHSCVSQHFRRKGLSLLMPVLLHLVEGLLDRDVIPSQLQHAGR